MIRYWIALRYWGVNDMTFNQIAIKDFKMHARRYLSFFICNSCTVMILFLYSTLMFNNEIQNSISFLTKDRLKTAVIAVTVFAVMFLGYAFMTFVKSRNRNMGLFITLGVTGKEMGRVIRIENTLIIAASLVAGLVPGILFSRLFFMVIIDMLGQDLVQYSLNVAEFAFAIGVFLSTFLFLTLWSNREVRKLELSDLLRYTRRTEATERKRPILVVAGCILILLAFTIKFNEIIYVPEDSVIFAILCFLGLYWIVTQLGPILLDAIREKKRLYHQNILGYSELIYKLTRSKTALYIMTILNTLIMYFVGTSFSAYLTGVGSRLQEGMMLLFVSIFIAALFFAAVGCIIYFKLFSEIEGERIRYRNLFRMGICKREVKRYIALELKTLFFLPLILGVIIIIPFIALDNIRAKPVTIMAYCICADSIYILIQVALYMLMKRRYINNIVYKQTV